MKKIVILLMIVLSSISLFAKGVVYVGTHAEFAPFEYLDKGKIVGFDIDLLNEVSKETGYEFKIVDMSFDGLLPALQTKKIDLVIAGMSVTQERKKSVLFSNPYFKAKQVVITKGKQENIKSFDDLVGKKVGVILGYTGDIVLTEKKGIGLEKYNAAYSAILALISGKIDAVVLDSEPAKHFVEKNKGLYLADVPAIEEDYAIAARKNDKEMVDNINKALEKIKADGTYGKLIEKYFQ